MYCWICGDKAISREHIIKASDLKSEFGDVSPENPLYINYDKGGTSIVRSIKRTESLKFESKLCLDCNNSRSQNFDRAWEKLSLYLRTNKSLSQKGRVNLVKIFPGSVRKEMLNIHLYFLKILGCALASCDAPINMSPLSDCIMNVKAHPYLYLTFGVNKHLGGTGISDLDVEMIGNRSSAVSWLYVIGDIFVKILLADPAVRRMGHEKGWHPIQKSRFLSFSYI